MSLLFLYHVFQVKLCITLFMHTLNFLLTSSVSVRWRTAKEWCPLTFDIFHMNFLLLMNQFRNMNALWVNVCYWWNQIKQGLWPSPVHIQEHELIFLKFLQPMLNTITFPIFIPVFFLPLALRSHSNSGLHLCKLECMLVYQNDDSWHIYLHFQH
jgi:hypothetical protein